MAGNPNHIEIKNRKASFQYQLLEKMEAGIVLTGTEIKSLREGKASIGEAYCLFQKGELYVKNLHIAEYKYGSHQNHEEKRDRKLLLKREELRKLERKVKEKGLTIVPLRLYIGERGIAKLEIALGQGKRSYDKRKSIQDKDMKREMDRRQKWG